MARCLPGKNLQLLHVSIIEFLQERLHGPFQSWQITLNNLPYGIMIDRKVIMHQDISHSNDLKPGDCRMSFF